MPYKHSKRTPPTPPKPSQSEYKSESVASAALRAALGPNATLADALKQPGIQECLMDHLQAFAAKIVFVCPHLVLNDQQRIDCFKPGTELSRTTPIASIAHPEYMVEWVLACQECIAAGDTQGVYEIPGRYLEKHWRKEGYKKALEIMGRNPTNHHE